MSRVQGTRRPCDIDDARKRFIDAKQFLEAATLLDAPDVVATNAIHAAIAASDAITCHALGERSADGNHQAAVTLLRTVDKKMAAALKRALDKKTQAAYESGDLSANDAQGCVRWAQLLINAAEERLRT